MDGTEPVCFELAGRRLTVALCGDLWDLPEVFAEVNVDAVLWPVWIGYTPEFWEAGEIVAYAERAAAVADRVVLVNSLANAMPDAPDWAGASWGGAAFFERGKVIESLPMGCPGTLILDL